MKKIHEQKPKKVQHKSSSDFVTKYRRYLLSGILEECVKKKISKLCLKHELDIVAMETDRDHIHLLLSYDATDSVSDMVHCLKQETTGDLWQKFYHILRTRYWKKHIFWSDGYFACSVGEASQSTIEHYIENQG